MVLNKKAPLGAFLEIIFVYRDKPLQLTALLQQVQLRLRYRPNYQARLPQFFLKYGA